QHTLDQLNNKAPHSCSAADLAAMRRVLISARYIRDITYYDDSGALCSASSGTLDFAYPHGEPSFYSLQNSSIWLDQPLGDFSQRVNGTVVRQRDYSVSIVSDIDRAPPRNDVRWQTVNTAGNAAAHIAGYTGLYIAGAGGDTLAAF